MEGTERDSTQDWLLPAGTGAPLLADLELRIDEALAIARASEEAVGAVGAAAIDAAEQARRAAEMAERASEVALKVSRAAAWSAGEAGRAAVATPPGDAGPATVPNASREVDPAIVASPSEDLDRPSRPGPPTPIGPLAAAGPVDDASLRNFSERADRVVARLRALQRRPRRPEGSSAAAGHRRPGG